MRKFVVFALAGLLLIALAGIVVFRSIAAKESRFETEVSPKAAEVLQAKIDAIKNSENSPKHKPGSSRVQLSEAELESYLMYSLQEDIPAKVDAATVELGSNTVGLETQLTFNSNATGNPMVDALVGGTHNLLLRGKLVAEHARGKFDLQDARVDGIPVPNIFIQTLFKKYVKPKYPEADLSEPFDMPWGIEELKLESGKATVVY
ncbi:MAG TPA: hypothetical protein VKY31_12180 [Terriglobia bacterium]|nr:hypothetical protein [Terriglobia bacterium]